MELQTVTNLRTFDLDPQLSSERGESIDNEETDVPCAELLLKQQICEMQAAFESEKFKLTQSYTVKLREEERHRIALLAKVSELERTKLALEKELFEKNCTVLATERTDAREEVEQLLAENRSLREIQQKNAGVDSQESRLELEQLRTQLRILDLEADSKREQVAGAQKMLSNQQTENRKLREEITQLSEEASDLRRENANSRLENERLICENAQLLARLQEYSEKAIQPQDCRVLQQRLEETTRRIVLLEQQIAQTSENYEELRLIAALSQSEGRRGKSKEGRGKRKKSKEGRSVLGEVSNEGRKKQKKKTKPAD